jgi:uncharacterized membrane protein
MKSQATNGSAHLWAIGYDDVDRAQQVRKVIVSLADPEHSLQLLDIAVLVRSQDSSLLLNGRVFPTGNHAWRYGTLGLLAGFAMAVPLLSDEAVARLFDSNEQDPSHAVGIDEIFKKEIGSMMRPGTSVLLVLDIAEHVNAILTHLRGLGGTILKTNVDLERANLIQATLAENASHERRNHG